MKKRINHKELLLRMLERFDEVDTTYNRTSGLFTKFEKVLLKIEAIYQYLYSIK